MDASLIFKQSVLPQFRTFQSFLHAGIPSWHQLLNMFHVVIVIVLLSARWKNLNMSMHSRIQLLHSYYGCFRNWYIRVIAGIMNRI